MNYTNNFNSPSRIFMGKIKKAIKNYKLGIINNNNFSNLQKKNLEIQQNLTDDIKRIEKNIEKLEI